MKGSEILTPAIKINAFEYQCLTYQESINVSLGVKEGQS